MAMKKLLSYEFFLKYYYKTNNIIAKKYCDREIINMVDWIMAGLPLNDIVVSTNCSNTNKVINGEPIIELVNFIYKNVEDCLQKYNKYKLKNFTIYQWETALQTSFFTIIFLENDNEIFYYS